MEIKRPEDWINAKLETSTIQNVVKANANEIKTRRIGKAKELEATSVRIAQEKETLSHLLDNAKNVLSRINVSEQNKVALSLLMSKLVESYSKYEHSTKTLAKRFQNAKIRVIAFGSKSQGKSSFIKSFTKLPDEIVASKKANSNADKTGTTCMFFHKKGVPANNPQIFVVFRKREDILRLVNDSLSMLSQTGFKINGKTSFLQWSELKTILDSKEKKQKIFDNIKNLQQDTPVGGFFAHKETLKNIFDPQSDYSELEDNANEDYFDKEKGKPISKSDLPMYNDMQHSGSKRFPIVSEIHIYVDLERDGMFENIEICDTKGISIEAGGSSWEEELYSELGNCDAAFSIQMDGNPGVGQSATKFYEDFNKEISNHKDTLHDMGLKHYIIINPVMGVEGANSKEIEDNAERIKDSNIAQSLYIGALIENAKYGDYTLDMQKFVDFVIYDMIQQIVVNTNLTDKNLEIALEDEKKSVNKLMADLKILLHNINKELPEKVLDWDDVLVNALFKKKKEVEEDIIKLAQQERITLPTSKIKSEDNVTSHSNKKSTGWGADEEDDKYSGTSSVEKNASEEDISTNEYVPEEKDISFGIYKMLTREQLQSKDPINSQQAVRKAIGYLFDKYIHEAGSKGKFLKQDIVGTAKYIGSYIDHLSSLLYDEVNQNVNHYFIANSDNNNLTDFKNKVFDLLWEGFYLDQLCEFKKFNVETLRSMIKYGDKKSSRLEKWLQNYESTGDNKATCIYPRTSYAILKAYFDSITKLPTEDELRSNVHSIFNEKELKEAVIKAYEYHDYVTRFKEQINNDIKNKRNVLTAIIADMGGEHTYVYELLDLYKILKPNDYGKILRDCGLVSSSEKEEFDNQEHIKSFQHIKEQIDSFKSSI